MDLIIAMADQVVQPEETLAFRRAAIAAGQQLAKPLRRRGSSAGRQIRLIMDVSNLL